MVQHWPGALLPDSGDFQIGVQWGNDTKLAWGSLDRFWWFLKWEECNHEIIQSWPGAFSNFWLIFVFFCCKSHCFSQLFQLVDWFFCKNHCFSQLFQLFGWFFCKNNCFSQLSQLFGWFFCNSYCFSHLFAFFLGFRPKSRWSLHPFQFGQKT